VIFSNTNTTDRWLLTGAVEVSAIEDILSGPCTVISGEALEKVLFLHVLAGTTRVCLSDAGEMMLTEQDVLVVFPGRMTTVELKASSNRLMLVALSGRDAVRATLCLGFWDLMRGVEHYDGNFMAEIIERFHTVPKGGKDEGVLSRVEHLLSTVWLRVCYGGGENCFARAIRTLNRSICIGECQTTDSAANALGVSRSKLNALFRNGMGIRPGEYISRVLVWLAQADLFWTSCSVAKVATRYGFASASSFSTFLRRRTGLKPTEFRKRSIPF